MTDLELLYKIIMSEDPIKEAENNKDILFKLIPELEECDNYNQMNKFHVYTLLLHILEVVSNCKLDLNTRLAALFHDVGKPRSKTLDKDGVAHYLGHAYKSLNIFMEFAKRNNLNPKDTTEISKLILYHEDELSLKTPKRLNFICKFNGTYNSLQKYFDLKKADILGQNPEYNDRLHRMEFIEQLYLNDIKILENLELDYNYLNENNLNSEDIIKDILVKILDKEINNNREDIIEYINKRYLRRVK